MSDKPKIYCFVDGYDPDGGEAINDKRRAGPWDGDCRVIALAEDGHVLAGHISSSESWAKHDIGIGSEWKHDKYAEHYPEGYELVWGEPPSEVTERNRALASPQEPAP